MGNIGRKIGKSQQSGDAPASDQGAGGGILDLFTQGYLQRINKITDTALVQQVGHTATGGVVNDYSDGGTVYRTHVFTSSGTFAVTELGTFDSSVDYLIVGGGGGGGGNYESGGGGAGGYRATTPEGPGGPSPSAESAYTIATGNYTVTVGAGGQSGEGITSAPTTRGKGVDGGQSAFFPAPVSYPHPTYIRSEGGGGGGAYSPDTTPSSVPGNPGGSGGGAGNQSPGTGGPFPGGTGSRQTGTTSPVPTQGYPGGTRGNQAHNPYYNGSGGGGAGEAGQGNDDNSFAKSRGGNGKASLITGTSVIRAGGGGGGLYNYSPVSNLPQTAGQGGGGAGGNGGSGSTDSTDGIYSTGGGGGGSGDSPRRGGDGGSGLVVIRYEIGSEQSGTAKATGGEISYYNGRTIHTFRSTGTFSVTNNGGANLLVDHFVVGGGGSGSGPYHGAGGGAGGVRASVPFGNPRGSDTQVTVTPSSPVAVTVGAGGAAWNGGTHTGPGPNLSPHSNLGANGGQSSFGPLVSPGGGAGGKYPSIAGAAGASGGGGGGNMGGGGGGASPNNNPDRFGYPGGAGGPTTWAGGGGGGGAGGSGGAGENGLGPGAPGKKGGDGGLGIQIPAIFRSPQSGVGMPGPGSAKYYVAGGGGGSIANQTLAGGGGVGGQGGQPVGPWSGGGNGFWNYGESGHENTGGGGGGSERGYSNDIFYEGGKGGSGIVIISYPT